MREHDPEYVEERVVEVVAQAPGGLPTIAVVDALERRGISTRIVTDAIWRLRGERRLAMVGGRLSIPERSNVEA